MRMCRTLIEGWGPCRSECCAPSPGPSGSSASPGRYPGCGSTTRCKPRLAAAAMGIHTAFDLLAVAAALLVFRSLKLPAATTAQA
jgi:hypothetical protein